MMRWWWFGPAVTKKELEREMRLMKEGGIGGFEVQAVYPLLPDDPSSGIKNLPYLSDAFIDALRFTSTKARELGLRMDLTLGSGWPYGGPSVPITDAAAMLRSERVKVQPNVRRITIPSITAGEKFLAAFLVRADGQSIVADSLRELADIHDGAVWLPGNLEASLQVGILRAGGDGRGELLYCAMRDGGLGDAGTAEHDDRVRDIVLGEQRLRLQIVEHQAHAAHIGALQEIGIAVGPAIARAGDDRLDPGRRRGVVGARVWPVVGQGPLALLGRRGLFHVGSLNYPLRGRLTTKASRGAAASHRLSVPARGRGRPSAEPGKGRLSNGDNKMGRYDGGNLRFQRPL